ncbi:MAG: mandelate racemase [Proteobacteria bacterium]|nr:mandelate racemase [Pseudomonadota bacterium]
MQITDIRETAIPLNSSLRNAVFDFSQMTTSIVAVITDVIRDGKPVVGYAFNSTGRYACGAQMRARFIPRILDSDPDSLVDEARGNLNPEAILAAMMRGEKPGGHSDRSVGIGTIEVAVWDAIAKIEEKPAYQSIADRYNPGGEKPDMFVYVGGGWYAPGKGTPELLDEMRGYLDMGYTQLKMKVGGASITEDLERLEAVLKLVGNDGWNLAVDANCGLTDDAARAYAKALSPYKLRWYEEPTDPLDFALMAELADIYEPPLATGENLFSQQDMQNLVTFGGMRQNHDVLQIDPPQSYGVVAVARTVEMLNAQGWAAGNSVMPHGGNQMSLHIAAGLGMLLCESYPNTFGMFSGFADDAEIIDGYLKLDPDRPGIGFEAQADLYKVMSELSAG